MFSQETAIHIPGITYIHIDTAVPLSYHESIRANHCIKHCIKCCISTIASTIVTEELPNALGPDAKGSGFGLDFVGSREKTIEEGTPDTVDTVDTTDDREGRGAKGQQVDGVNRCSAGSVYRRELDYVCRFHTSDGSLLYII